MVTSAFTRGGRRQSYRVFSEFLASFGGVFGSFWRKLGETIMKLVLFEGKIWVNVTVVQVFTRGMNPAQNDDVL